VFSIASGFIVSCPASSPPLPFTAFPPLVTESQTVKSGEIVRICGEVENGLFAVVISGIPTISGSGTFPAPVLNGQFVFPNDASISGQVYLVLSKNGSATDDQIIAGPAILNAN